MGLKGAWALSAALHLALLSARMPTAWAPSPQALHSIEVFYTALPSAEGRSRSIVPAPKEPASPVSPSVSRGGPTPRVPESREPSPAGRREERLPSRALKPSSEPDPTGRPAPSLEDRSARPRVAPPAGAAALAEGTFEALEHKRQVREHLRRHLRFPAAWREGSVRLLVGLDRDGTLRSARVLESTDPVLAQAALEDARRAEPYPRLPASVKPSQARYEFLVRYRLK